MTLFIVLGIVQYVSVFSCSDNGSVSKPFGAISNKFMGKFSFDFIFPNPGFDKRQHPSKPFFSNITRLLNLFNFLGRFYRPQLLKNGIAFSYPMGGIGFFAPVDKPIFSSLGFHGLAVMFVGIKIKTIALDAQFLKDSFKILKPVYRLNATSFTGLFLRQFGSFPYSNMRICFS